MSFRLRLILAFAALALLQAAFFTLLSDQLIRDGIEGEANARLALVGSLFERELDPALWPAPPRPSAAWDQAMLAELKDFADTYGLERATLLRGAKQSWDSASDLKSGAPVLDRWLADGLRPPKVSGKAHISGPLFHAENGWHKTLYYHMPKGEAWLRIEAGTPFLGAVAALQKRLFRLALALVLPSLLIGLGLALALSRRAAELRKKLEGARAGLALGGKDEFTGIASSVDLLLKRLVSEQELSEKLLKSRVSQARHLAFGVAHELRNPLAGMSLMAELLGRKAAEGAPAAELSALAGRVLAEAARVEHTVARFLEFARTPQLEPEPLALRALAEAAAQGLRPQPAITGEAQARADAKACGLIVGILLSNACEAAGESGQVAVSLSGETLRVWDSGAPLPPESRDRLFSPFYTTKPRGMGLGLATASGLADAMGGRLALLADAKTFELRLPPA